LGPDLEILVKIAQDFFCSEIQVIYQFSLTFDYLPVFYCELAFGAFIGGSVGAKLKADQSA
jgi:hypothetical protein